MFKKIVGVGIASLTILSIFMLSGCVGSGLGYPEGPDTAGFWMTIGIFATLACFVVGAFYFWYHNPNWLPEGVAFDALLPEKYNCFFCGAPATFVYGYFRQYKDLNDPIRFCEKEECQKKAIKLVRKGGIPHKNPEQKDT